MTTTMPISDLLQRLRPAGAPGPAGPVAVPAAEDGASAELALVFAALAPVVEQCRAVRAAAERRAAAAAARAEREADAVVAAARARAPAERAAAAAGIRISGDEAATELRAAAQDEATRLLAHGRRQLPGLVERVVSSLRDPEAPGDAAARHTP